MPPSTRQTSGDQDPDPTIAKKKGWLPEEGAVKWAINRGADIWAGFGKEKSGWKVCSVHSSWLNNAMTDGFLGFSRKYIALESG